MFLIHDATPDLFKPLHADGRPLFQTPRSTDRTRSYLPVYISFSCGILEVKVISADKHGIAVHTPSIRCPTRMDAVRNLCFETPRTLAEIKLARISVRLQIVHPASRHPSHLACTKIQASKDTEKAL